MAVMKHFTIRSSLSSGTVLALLKAFSHFQGTALLHSGGSRPTARYSYLALIPFDCIGIFHGEEDPWGTLQERIGEVQEGDLPDWIGFLSYEMGARADAEKVLDLPTSDFPLALFWRHTVLLRWDLAASVGEVWIRDIPPLFDSSGEREILKDLSDPEYWEEMIGKIGQSVSQPAQASLVLKKRSDSCQSYFNKIDRVHEYILKGDVYQVNLSQKFVFQGSCEPCDIFRKLVQKNPSSFSAYLQHAGWTILSSSPERLLEKRGRCLETRPIKGTAPRGATLEEDLANRKKLVSSEKERAELLMITDLMRNDLGKVSQAGTVQTLDLWHCEEYQNVFHMLSIIQGEALAIHPVEVLRSCFPGGSVTGCPKIRSMEVIAELEECPRDIYCGSIGYFTAGGDFDFNIAIRTVLVQNDTLSVRLGGAIVADSVARQEYEETLHKGCTIFQVLGIEPDDYK